MEDEHIEKLVSLFDSKENLPHVAATVSNDKIAENDYNLSVSSYVEAENKAEPIDIIALNSEIAETVKKITQLRADIDKIVKEIEG